MSSAASSAHGHGHADTRPADVARLTDDQGKKLVSTAGGVAAVGVLAMAAAYLSDKERFAYSYLPAFAWFVTLGLGALMFILIQHLTRASWSVAVRRQAEWLTNLLPVGLILFIPVAAFAHQLYHEWMGPEAAKDPAVMKKVAYLNASGFYVRALIFFVLWSAIAFWYSNTSKDQDTAGGLEHHRRMQKWAAPAILLTAPTLTLGGIDWLMSLDPHWYSTIFGVYIFAGAMTSSHAALALMTISLQNRGFFNRVSTVEHQHDVGKLLFGWTVFFAYIGFSQFFLIWYANIPEETIFFIRRTHHGWENISLLILFGHFVLPFLVLMSRHAKRSKPVLAGAAVWMLFMHWVDMYWLVMPSHDTELHLQWQDLATALGPFGIACLVVAVAASKSSLYPLKDPFIPETLKNENL
ncbi:MAG: hypothetical protein ACHREM_06885 [Polyangiales bacterium]